MSELLELPCEVVVRRSRLGKAETTSLAIWLSGEGLQLGVEAEPALATFLASRVLRRSEPLTDPRKPLSPALAGLLAALCVEIARRCGARAPLRLVEEPLQLTGAPALADEATLVDATVILEGRPFSVRVLVLLGIGFCPEEPPLSALGPLLLELPLVVASLTLERSELSALEVGAALLPPPEAALTPNGLGRGVLASALSERGIAVEIRADGRLVVGEVVDARLNVEREKPGQTDGETLTDVLLEAPLVVRIELGAVSMTAREWAGLGPGDVIETAQRIAAPVVLRVAGREVGRGELVNVDGQVGVRIQKLFGEET